jgi:hypothetical protein
VIREGDDAVTVQRGLEPRSSQHFSAAIFGGTMTLPKYAVIALCAGLMAGCSSGAAKAKNQEMTDLQELKQLLRAAAKRTGHPPARLSDLDLFQAKYPEVYNLVKSGDLVVLWETPINMEKDAGKPEKVLAYGKDVPTNGGYVLMSAGNVTKMSAAEFASAPKAKK